MHTSIQKWGNSSAVRIPKDVLERGRFKESDQVEIVVDKPGVLLIKKSKRRYANLDELFVGYKGDYKCVEADTGDPVGREVF